MESVRDAAIQPEPVMVPVEALRANNEASPARHYQACAGAWFETNKTTRQLRRDCLSWQSRFLFLPRPGFLSNLWAACCWLRSTICLHFLLMGHARRRAEMRN